MPFYEYECQACKYYTEVMQKISDAPLSKCPSCGKRALKKLVSAPVFRLKGAGWYETDFKSDKESKRNLLGSEKDEPKAESKTEGKTEGKAEGKAEGKEAKPAVKDGKDGKDSAPAKDKAAEPKAAAGATRRSVSVPARGGAAGRRAKRAGAKSARKRRR
jgi:putative FmdB family regulatory protein